MSSVRRRVVVERLSSVKMIEWYMVMSGNDDTSPLWWFKPTFFFNMLRGGGLNMVSRSLSPFHVARRLRVSGLCSCSAEGAKSHRKVDSTGCFKIAFGDDDEGGDDVVILNTLINSQPSCKPQNRVRTD
jgi:hypothetical protein